MAAFVHGTDAVAISVGGKNMVIVECRPDHGLVAGDALPWRLVFAAVNFVARDVELGVRLPA